LRFDHHQFESLLYVLGETECYGTEAEESGSYHHDDELQDSDVSENAG